jgi:hypothetical protein
VEYLFKNIKIQAENWNLTISHRGQHSEIQRIEQPISEGEGEMRAPVEQEPQKSATKGLIDININADSFK